MKHRGLRIALIIIVLLIAAYAAAGWFFSSQIIDAPTQSLADAAAEGDTPADFGLPEPENITIDTGEVTLAGWLFQNPRHDDCGVMFLHGYRGTRYHVLNWAPLFWKRGCDILAYDHQIGRASCRERV